MKKEQELNSWSSKQAVAILAVSGIQMSEHGLDLLKRVEDGAMTSDEARAEIINRASERVRAEQFKAILFKEAVWVQESHELQEASTPAQSSL